MQIESLTGLEESQIDSTIAHSRVVLFSPRLRSRNVLLARFTREPDALLYTLSPNDTEFAAFLQHLVQALSELTPGSYSQISQALSNRRSKVMDYADALAADLSALRPRPSNLTLDEFDYLESSSEVQAFFKRFVEHLPNETRLVINGRMLAFSPWRELLQNGDAVVLGEQMALDGGILTPDNMDLPQLEVYGFGAGSVFVNGRLVDVWDGPLPRSLFYYFVDHPLITRNDIFETFWPELAKKEATNVFHVTKRKISERLGIEVTSYSGGFYRPSEALRLHYDVARFEENYRRGDSKHDKSEIEDWYRTIHLYRSEFLHTMDMPWINERREQLRREYTEALIGVGRIFKSLLELEKAAHYFVRALREQPNREDIHREVMSIYYTEGKIDRAVAQYHQLEGILRRTLNIKPAPSTVLLYNMITGQST